MACILIIDDDDDFRSMLRRILERAGYIVLDASDGNEGIKCYHRKQIDLVITDIFMPEKEGIETIIELKRSYPDIKIIAVSGGGWQGKLDYLEQAKELGAAKIFEKPFINDELLSGIKELV